MINNQEVSDLLAEKKQLQEAFKNLRLDMKDSVDYEAANEYRKQYEALQLKLSCIESEINIAKALQMEAHNQEIERQKQNEN